MTVTPHLSLSDGVAQRLAFWLSRSAPRDGLAWLDQTRDRIANGSPDRVLFAAFSAVPRYLGKRDLDLSEEELDEADRLRPGWRPLRWSSDQAGRTLLLLSIDTSDAAAFEQRLTALFEAADVGELVALYQSLPLLPFPDRHAARAAEGVRTNMTSIFEAVALYNPYPAERFDDDAWNQMILKAVFVDSPLFAIQGLDRRANPTLARMLVDYAHERWAAKRPVTPELWRPVGPFAGDAIVEDLERVLRDPDPAQQEAAALALAQSPAPRAKVILGQRPDLEAAIGTGRLTWDLLGRRRPGTGR